MTSSARSDTNLIIRRARADDTGLLVKLGASTFAETFAADNSPEDLADYLASAFGEAQQSTELADPDATFYIAESDSVAVGYAMLRSGSPPEAVTEEKPIELVRLYVSREHLGQGVGAALMRACIDEAGSNGYRTLWLGVWENNHLAQAFYRKWNFHEVGTHIFQLGNDPQRDILMARAINVADNWSRAWDA